jgi:hypothetical protein
MTLRIMPIIVAAFLLSAHFLRESNWAAMIVCLLAPTLLLVKKRWSLMLLQGLAYLGAGIWVWTTISLMQQRLAFGEPWLRLVVILGVVILFTVWAGLLLNTKPVKKNYSP